MSKVQFKMLKSYRKDIAIICYYKCRPKNLIKVEFCIPHLTSFPIACNALEAELIAIWYAILISVFSRCTLKPSAMKLKPQISTTRDNLRVTQKNDHTSTNVPELILLCKASLGHTSNSTVTANHRIFVPYALPTFHTKHVKTAKYLTCS